MKSTTRNRMAALGIAALTGLGGVGLVSGPALADSAPQAATSSTEAQSEGATAQDGDYLDEFMEAWAFGDIDQVEKMATSEVVSDLSAHGNENADHWKQTSSDGAAGTIYVNYENTVSGEKLTVGVHSDALQNGGDDGVVKVEFTD